MAGQPLRQVDVEVVPAVIRVVGSHICQRAAPSVEQKDYRLKEYDAGEHGRMSIPVCPCKDRDRDDAPNKEGPNHSMQELDGAELAER